MLHIIIALLVVSIIILILQIRSLKKDYKELSSNYERQIKQRERHFEHKLKEFKDHTLRKKRVPIPLSWIERFIKMFDACADKENRFGATYELWKTIENKFPETKDKKYSWKVRFDSVTKPCLVGEKIPGWQREEGDDD